MRIIASLGLLPLTLVGAIGVACADTYPVSGMWTYENASQSGPAKNCNAKKSARFNGVTRLDTATSAPDYKNVSVTREGSGAWRIVDEFYTLQIRGRVTYSLRVGAAGTYQVIPATGQETYFPEVYGRSDGSLFTILPADK